MTVGFGWRVSPLGDGVDEGQRRCHGTSAGVIKVNVAWGPLL